MERQVREETANNVKGLFQKGAGFEVGQTEFFFIITPCPWHAVGEGRVLDIPQRAAWSPPPRITPQASLAPRFRDPGLLYWPCGRFHPLEVSGFVVYF